MKIRSGGQSGVDRAALEVARELGIEIVGWCPKNGWSEDVFDIRTIYPELKETPSSDITERTRWNVRDADATLIIRTKLSVGTVYTINQCIEMKKPYCIADDFDVDSVKDWLAKLPKEMDLNIAGPRESEDNGIKERTKAFLKEILK